MAHTRTVSIVQPALPRYRVPFFDALARDLAEREIKVEVVLPSSTEGLHGPGGRGDAAPGSPSWVRRVDGGRAVTVHGRRLQSQGRALRPKPGDAVVIGLQASLVDAWRLLLPPGRDYRVGLWGHVGSFVAPGNRADLAAERFLMRRSDHVFAYTEEGAALARRTVGPRVVTAVQNSIDTTYLLDPRGPAVAADVRSRFGLVGDRHLAYIGALDISKRIDLLAAALEELHRLDPQVRVLVAGEGQDGHLLDPAVARGQVIRLGFGTDDIKAAIPALCSALLMPGRVGLVAVDALAMGLPLVTAEGSRHGPEHAYLIEGQSLLTSAAAPLALARTALSALDRPRQAWSYPTLDAMVSNFASGVRRMLHDDPRPGSWPRASPPSATSSKPPVAWVTNFDAPYRRPVWEELARTTDLTVLLTSDQTGVDARARGTDWFTSDARNGYRKALAATRSRRVLNVDMALARRRSNTLLPRRGHVVLGGWESPVYWQLAWQARRRSNRLVGFYESTARSQRFQRGPVSWVRAVYFRGLDAVIVPGREAERAVLAMGVPADRIYVGFNPVEVEVFREAAARRRPGPDPTAWPGHRYLFVGQLIERKNLAALIDAFLLMSADGDSLTIVGSGPLEEELSASAAAHRGITMRPHVLYDEVPGIMAEHHTLVLPSTEEVWGLVANEALAAGLHAVVSERAGVASSVRGMRGVWITPTDTVGLARAMEASRRTWSGWIDEPEMWEHTPVRFADEIRKALGVA